MKSIVMMFVSFVAVSAMAEADFPQGIYADKVYRLDIDADQKMAHVWLFERSLLISGNLEPKRNATSFKLSSLPTVWFFYGDLATNWGCAGEQGEVALSIRMGGQDAVHCLKKF